LELVSGAGKTMDEVVASVLRVSNTIKEISSATSEQSAKLTVINREFQQLDSMTHQNSAMFEESTAASMTLKEQAERLKDLLQAFRVEQGVEALPERTDAMPGTALVAQRRWKRD
jgi:methyl-accepting chemotaxis protein